MIRIEQNRKKKTVHAWLSEIISNFEFFAGYLNLFLCLNNFTGEGNLCLFRIVLLLQQQILWPFPYMQLNNMENGQLIEIHGLMKNGSQPVGTAPPCWRTVQLEKPNWPCFPGYVTKQWRTSSAGTYLQWPCSEHQSTKVTEKSSQQQSQLAGMLWWTEVFNGFSVQSPAFKHTSSCLSCIWSRMYFTLECIYVDTFLTLSVKNCRICYQCQYPMRKGHDGVIHILASHDVFHVRCSCRPVFDEIFLVNLSRSAASRLTASCSSAATQTGFQSRKQF